MCAKNIVFHQIKNCLQAVKFRLQQKRTFLELKLQIFVFENLLSHLARFNFSSAHLESGPFCKLMYPNHEFPLTKVLNGDLSNGSLVEVLITTQTSPCPQFQWPSGSLPVLVTYQSYCFSVISNSCFSFGISDSLNLLLMGNS